jgi:transposase
MNKITQFQRWCKTIRKDRNRKVYIGLDVHKRTIYMAIWYNGRIVITFSLPSDYGHLIRTLEQIPASVNKIVYEAGPTGFGLARALENAGYSVEVIAPSSLLEPRGQHAKSDRLDCRALAEQVATSTQLKKVAIPTVREEHDRQTYRLRGQFVKKRKRVKQQIKSFLLQHSLPEPEGLDKWTKASLNELRQMELPKELAFARLIMISELEELSCRIRDVEDHLNDFFSNPHYQQKLEILRSHPAVGPLTALAFCLEIHQPERFRDGNSIAKYVGLAPKILQSGETSRKGKIMKVGKNDLRSIMVEASWRWIGLDKRARDLYDRLRKNSGNSNKAIVGVARHLAIILWRMLLDKKEYQKVI